MVKPLFIGLIFGALFTSLAPKEYTSLLFENQLLTYFVIILFAMPLYICATASLPIAAALIIEGMSPGAAFIFLTAGPATSMITMSVVYKTLGKTSLIIYLSTILFLSLIFGFLFDTIFSEINIINFDLENEHSSLLSQIASLIMLIMLAYYLIKPWIQRKNSNKSCCSDTSSCCSNDDNTKENSNNLKFSDKANMNNKFTFKANNEMGRQQKKF